MKTSTHYWLLATIFVVALLPCNALFAQMSGTYHIGPGDDFESFQEASDSLESQGVNGPVNILVEAGTYDEQVEINMISGTSSDNTVTFQSATGDSTDVVLMYEATESNANYVVKMFNTSHLTFRSITFHAKGTTYGRGVILEGVSNNITFTHCRFKGYYNTNNRSQHASVFSTDQLPDSLYFYNNLFDSVTIAIYLNSSNANVINDVEIINNNFRDIGYQAIFFSRISGGTIDHNKITGCYVAIRSGTSYSNAVITNNRIICKQTGILYSSVQYLPEPGLIANNHIFITDDAGHCRGLSIGGFSPVNIYHNTVILGDGGLDDYALYINNFPVNDAVNVINNILACYNEGVPFNNDYQLCPVDTLDYNCYYTAGKFMGRDNGKWLFNLEDVRNQFGQDQHSFTAIPVFSPDTSVYPATAWINDKGISLPTVTTDIDGESRDDSHPDVGADEYTPPAYLTTPYAGDYAIGPGEYFDSLAQAIDSLLLKGISDEVRLNFSSGTHIAHVSIPAIPGSGPDKYLVLQSQSGNPEDVLIKYEEQSNIENGYVINCHGTDYMKVRNLSLKAGKLEGLYSNYARVFKLFGGTENLSFTGNHLESVYSENNRPHLSIFFSNNMVHYYDSLVIANNEMDSCAVGIYFQNYGYYQDQNKPVKLHILNNELSHVGYNGLHLQNHNAPTIKNNVIDSKSRGMYLHNCINNTTITGNQVSARIHYAIGVEHCPAVNSSRGLVANNFITITGTYDAQGINMLHSENYDIVYNSVHVTSNHIGSRAIHASDGAGLVVLNNIFTNMGGGYAAKYNGGLSVIDSMDFNDYYTSGNDLALWESTVCPDLDFLQSASGMDQHSLSVDPGFVSDIDLHLNSPAVTEHATPIPFVTIDIDGQDRDAFHPDMGADEYEATGNLSPEVTDSIADYILKEDSDTTAIARLDTVFADPNPADELNYTAVSDTSSVDVFVIDTVLNVKPDTNFFGMAEIVVTATDPSDEAASDTFRLTVTNVQDAPVAVDDTVETHQNTAVMIEVLSNDIDVDGDSLTITHVTQGMNGSASVMPGDSLIEYTPNQNFIGRDTLHYGISDGKNGYDTAAIYVLVARIPIFEEITINLDSVAFGNAVWGDYDNDADLDILITGEKQGGVNIYSVYENQDGAFKKASFHFGADDYGVRCNNDRSISWFDLDGDNRLEFILTGETNSHEYITEIFDPVMERNIITDLPGVFNGSVDWGDYDKDGDPDLLITGETAGSSQITEIYRNDGEKQVYGDQVNWKFTPVSNELPDLKSSQGVWADLDSDGDLDIILSGKGESGNLVKYLYWNDNGEFSTHGPLAYGQADGSIAPCDYDGDGDLDVLFTGDIVGPGYVPQTYLLENEGGTFSEVETPIEGVLFSSSDWGDYDNDGDFDLVICGKDENLTSITHVYTNDNGTFKKADFGLPGIAEGTVRWGDYDNDNDLDILLSGYKSDEPNRFTAIYRNNIKEKNTLPTAPEIFSVTTTDSTATLRWSRATDGESDSLLLTYNLELKQRTHQNRVISPMAHENGYRKVVRTGNSSSNTSRAIINLKPGTYYEARLQAIDAAYAGSEFTELMFHTSSDYFIEDSTILTEFIGEAIEFADYDQDGDLDLIAVNSHKDSLMIYPNSDGFISNNPILLGESSMWGIERINDYDNDNDVDVLLTEIGNEKSVAIYTNQDGSFTSTELDVAGIDKCEAAWGDFDNDGDEDLIISGLDEENESVCKLYRNNNGSFEDHSHLFTGVTSGDIHFVDYDMDGDQDIFMCGSVAQGEVDNIKLYKNMGGAFDIVYPDIPKGRFASADFGDFDNDKDPDLLICLYTQGEPLTRIYQNENNEFVLYDASLNPLSHGDCKWADFNNDGLLDIIISGTSYEGWTTEVYYNNEGAFSKVIELDGFPLSQIALGDYNNDQKLDFMVAGRGFEGDINGLFYKNVTSSGNLAPDPPEIQSAVPEANSLTFSWTQATDNETPRNGLSYNLRVGTTPGGSEIVSPLSLENGIRQVVNIGNTGQNTTWKIHGVDTTTNYYYSVQTIDNGYLASEFTSEKVFIFEPNSIEEIETGITVYPNPTSGLLYLKMKGNYNIRELEVINSVGSVVLQMEVQQNSLVIDLTNHPDGMYVIRSRGGGKVIISKIMKY